MAKGIPLLVLSMVLNVHPEIFEVANVAPVATFTAIPELVLVMELKVHSEILEAITIALAELTPILKTIPELFVSISLNVHPEMFESVSMAPLLKSYVMPKPG